MWILLAIVTLACGGQDTEPTAQVPAASPETGPAPEPATPPAIAVTPADEARGIFATRCATCHGAEGAGDGPGAQGLDPGPRNFRDPAWQASVVDADLARIIVHGGPAVGKSPLMPPNPDLTARPEVVDALVQQIRRFARP